MKVDPAVSRALVAGRAVVALESSVFAQGLPRPANARAARLMTAAVAEAGAVPAITGVVRGIPTVGLRGTDLRRFLRRTGVVKVSSRDIAPAVRAGLDGATTVAAALALANECWIEVLATGGIGGVHRGSRYDESADLIELARTPMVVVCSGAKVILDIPATVERLEALAITVVGYRTDVFPAFYAAATDIPVPSRVQSAGDVAELFRAHVSLGRRSALLVVQPPPRGYSVPSRTVETAIARGLESAERAGVTGSAVTPYLLAAVERSTRGRSVAANVALLERNAALAAEIAVAVARRRATGRKNR